MAVEFDGPDGAEGIDHQDDSDPVAGLRKATQAEREKRQDAERRAQELETQVAELRGRVEGMAATHKPEKTSQPEWTSAQLRQAVEEGRLSEDQAEEIKFKQAEARVRESVTKEVRQELTTNEMKAKIGGEIARYNASVPDINDRTSQAFAKLQGEYRYLVSLGHDPNDAKTELLAARAAFGPVEALEKSGKAKARETWAESGGGADPSGDRGGGGKDAPPSDMPAKHRDFYRAQIAKGIYRDWEAVKKEWSYKPKNNSAARQATA